MKTRTDNRPTAIPVGESLDGSSRLIHRPMPNDGDMDITPMIDITFLLLIFFLVATRMDTESAIELPAARNGTAVAAKSAVIFTVTRGDGEGAFVFQGDGAVSENLLPTTDLAKQEQEIMAYVEAGLNARIPKRHVIIKAEREVKHREVARVAKAVGQLPDVPLYVAVYEEQ
jgi:biopolymer transport protein ExbD